jgi:nuclear pore complex protein Nup133
MVTIANIVHLSYVAHADPRMLDVPRLYIPTGSQTAFVRFADAIVMTSLVASQPYEDTITLNDSATNAFIGIGSTAGPQRKANTASLVAMAATGGIMNIDVHQGVVKAKQLSSVAAATARIKSKIEQAVFFGDRSEVS